MMDGNLRKIRTNYKGLLPLKDIEVTFSNSRYLAEKRQQHLQRRFIKNPKFFRDYMGFIEELFGKCYVKMTIKEDPVGRKWCIPHDGVNNPKKIGKICLFLDYFAEFKGISLNKNLIRYPDLTNQIVNRRFRD